MGIGRLNGAALFAVQARSILQGGPQRRGGDCSILEQILKHWPDGRLLPPALLKREPDCQVSLA